MSYLENIGQTERNDQTQSSEDITNELGRFANLSDQQISQARALSKAQGISFLEAAIATGAVNREAMMAALSKQYNYPIIHSDDNLARFSRELVVGHEPFGAAAEIIRSMRTAIVSSAVTNGVRAFAIVGARENQGVSFVAGNLAVAFAQMAVTTLLVDANLRNPRIAGMFGAPPDGEGLTDALLHKQRDKLPIIYDVLPGLSLLTSGGVPPNPQELLCSGDFIALTADLKQRFGIVIYDTSPAMEFADAFVVASRVGAAVIATRKDSATFNDVKKTAEKLRASQCTIIGSVINCY